jgi:hypothetical protein
LINQTEASFNATDKRLKDLADSDSKGAMINGLIIVGEQINQHKGEIVKLRFKIARPETSDQDRSKLEEDVLKIERVLNAIEDNFKVQQRRVNVRDSDEKPGDREEEDWD